jgi:hypothetical protein
MPSGWPSASTPEAPHAWLPVDYVVFFDYDGSISTPSCGIEKNRADPVALAKQPRSKPSTAGAQFQRYALDAMNIYGIQEPFPDGTEGESLHDLLERFKAWFKAQMKAGNASEEDGALAALYRVEIQDAIVRGDDRAPDCPFSLLKIVSRATPPRGDILIRNPDGTMREPTADEYRSFGLAPRPPLKS